MKILLETKPVISMDSILNTNYAQSITSLTKINEKVCKIHLSQILLATSDLGHLYIVENGDKYLETMNLLDQEEKIKPNDLKKKSNGVSSGSHKNKARRNLFTPY